MKTKLRTALVLVSLLAFADVALASGGSRVPPPTAEKQSTTTWYEDLADLFNVSLG